ncbi:GNAT family N-acetyltransferase [Marinomonas sp. THO17]|uniref:GNAT family N-acetyltransferase n=1 Tax=Marinomonas sp. THO17 TaxID=3149048 RepID=UPI00336C234C
MIQVRIANVIDLEAIESLVAQYHEFEGIESSAEMRRAALLELVASNKQHGFIVVATSDENIIGYAAICYGFSIEFGGRDAFLDEVFVAASFRRNGIGDTLIRFAEEIAKKDKIQALHLEVSKSNEKARSLYSGLGFENREAFHLMSKRLND